MEHPAVSEPRSFTRLSPELLARKGSAHPAMRQQLPIREIPDGGHLATRPHVQPSMAIAADGLRGPDATSSDPHLIAPETSGDSLRVSISLRLDTERHLKLRLASIVANRSSQEIVSEAVDRLLAQFNGLDAFVENLKQT